MCAVVVSRATFLRIFAVGCLGVRLEPCAAAASESAGPAGPGAFQPHLGDTFTVFPEDGGAPVRARLAKIVELPRSRSVEQYSLIFHAAPDASVADGIHEVRHGALGTMAVFMSTIGAMDDVRAWQACFSRPVGM